MWYEASVARYQRTAKMWTWLNHLKGHLQRSERSNFVNFLKNCLKITFSLFWPEASPGAWCWTAKIWICSKGNFSRPERSEKGQHLLKLVSFFYF